MESNSNTIALVDKTAIGLSLLCLAHCLLLPIVVPVLPFLVSFEEATHFHEIFAVLVVAMAGFAFWRGFKLHGNPRILFFGILGGLTLALALLLPSAGHSHGPLAHAHTHGAELHIGESFEWMSAVFSPQGLLTSVGGLLLIGAHLVNIRECKCTLADRNCHCSH